MRTNRNLEVLAMWFIALSCVVHAQNPQPMSNPEDLGLMVPRGRTATEVSGRNVLLRDEDERGDQGDEDAADEEGNKDEGAKADASRDKPARSKRRGAKKPKPLVAKVYVEIGDRYIVLLPDGALRSVLKRDTTPTDRPFEPADKDDLARQLRRQFPGFKTRATRRYLCVYNTTDSFCESKTAILETMYPMLKSYFNRQKFDVEDAETPLIVVMFRTKREFLRYRKMPETLLAYYNGVNNRVFLYQYSDASVDTPLIASMQSTSTIAHEGVHQILHNIGVQKRLAAWPIWISEGMAEYFAPTSTNRSKWKGVGKPNNLRMRELFKHFNSVRGLGSGNMIQHVVNAKQLNSTEYAIVWALTHYLATKRKSDLFKYMRDVSKITALEEPDDEMVRFMKFFGTDFAKIEREMIKHVRSLPYADPIANQPYFLITAMSGRKRYAMITSSLETGKAQRELLQKMNPADRLKARLLPPTPYRNLALAKQAMAIFTRKK